eukprot:SAG22_NODE_3071_length_1963_cov_4.269313_2_plen_224_part_00
MVLAALASSVLLVAAALGAPPPVARKEIPVPAAMKMKPGCARLNLASQARGVFYFAPTVGSDPNILVFDSKAGAWGAPIPITGAGAGVVKSLAGSTMSAVEAVEPGIDDYLVFGGGVGSDSVTQYNLRTKAWSSQPKKLSHVTTNLCSSGCLGYAFFATGDFKAAGSATAAAAAAANNGTGAVNVSASSLKPTDRQIQVGAGSYMPPPTLLLLSLSLLFARSC